MDRMLFYTGAVRLGQFFAENLCLWDSSSPKAQVYFGLAQAAAQSPQITGSGTAGNILPAFSGPMSRAYLAPTFFLIYTKRHTIGNFEPNSLAPFCNAMHGCSHEDYSFGKPHIQTLSQVFQNTTAKSGWGNLTQTHCAKLEKKIFHSVQESLVVCSLKCLVFTFGNSCHAQVLSPKKVVLVNDNILQVPRLVFFMQ